jgi:hypothetical protein
MKKSSLLTLIAVLGSSLLHISPLRAQEVKEGMHSLLKPLRELQPFIADQDQFSSPANNQKVGRLLQDLRTNFHSLESIPSRYQKVPGFAENLKLMSDLLDDATRRFSEGKVSYAWWRARGIPTNCFACHATYKVSTSYSNEGAIDPTLNTLDRARFLLATRQFTQAQEALLQVLKDPSFRFSYDEALRSLLVVVTRINKSPNEGIALFKDVLATSKLPEEDAHEVKGWIESLEKWRDSKAPSDRSPLEDGEKLIVAGAARGLEYYQDDVSLLRGTALVHDVLEKGELSPERRRHALYLLGFAYSSLPGYFAESWAGMYLEQCITEFPGTKDAQRAYRVYRDMTTDEFTGSGGTNLPDEVKLHLEELRKKAFGEPSFAGRV